MKISAMLFLIATVMTSTAAQQQRVEEILRNDFETPDADGAYRWAYRTEGGIYHEERGTPSRSTGEPVLKVEGQYQYTAPDGQVINLLYTADENGFRPTGDHLPTPPPIPAAIQRALDYLATLPPSDDNRLR